MAMTVNKRIFESGKSIDVQELATKDEDFHELQRSDMAKH